MYYLDNRQKTFYRVKSSSQAPEPSRILVRFENDPIVQSVVATWLVPEHPPEFKLGWPLSFLQELKMAARGAASEVQAIENAQVVIDRWLAKRFIGGCDLMPAFEDGYLLLMTDGFRESTKIAVGKRF